MSRAPGPFTGYGRRSKTGNGKARNVAEGQRRLGSVPGSTRLLPLDADPPRKTDCPGHVAGRDDLGRYPVGDCGPGCLMRAFRLGRARWQGGRWIVPEELAQEA